MPNKESLLLNVFKYNGASYPRSEYDRDLVEHHIGTAFLATEITKWLIINNEITFDNPGLILKQVKIAALLHDIGKLYMNDIVCWEGSLSEEQRKIINLHPIFGANLLERKNFYDVAKIIRHHHEKCDGSGYPDGLKRSQIPFASRIICVADVVDSLKGKRKYQKGKILPLPKVYIAENSGNFFDPVIANAYLNLGI